MDRDIDVVLVTQAQAGDKAAFGKLIERHQHMVHALATSMLSQREIARDLAQEALLQAYLSLNSLRDTTRFKSWLYGITLNLCHNALRNAKAPLLSLEALTGGMYCEPDVLSEHSIDPQAVAEERELHQSVLQAVAQLSPRDRIATLLFYYEQLSLDEIATLLGISLVAVKGRLHRARKRLRVLLEPLLDEERVAALPAPGRKPMIPVHIQAVRTNFTTQQRVVILEEETKKRVLIIWVAPPEAQAIAQGLHKTATARPMTMQFMANLLQVTGVQVEEVRISALENEVYYATVKVRNGDTVQEIDARPSDALTLATQINCPIYVAEEVMERVGFAAQNSETLAVLDNSKAQVLDILQQSAIEKGEPFDKEQVAQKLDEFAEKSPHLTLPGADPMSITLATISTDYFARMREALASMRDKRPVQA